MAILLNNFYVLHSVFPTLQHVTSHLLQSIVTDVKSAIC